MAGVAGLFFVAYLLLLSNALNIALHAQSRYSQHRWVAGSEVTTAGLKKAFQKIPDVDNVVIFAPFVYEGIQSLHWDLVIIEGWTGPVPMFINEMRAINPDVVVIHYCLDTYPRLELTLQLDVDGFFTNSNFILSMLSNIAPTAVVHLAAGDGV